MSDIDLKVYRITFVLPPETLVVNLGRREIDLPAYSLVHQAEGDAT